MSLRLRFCFVWEQCLAAMYTDRDKQFVADVVQSADINCVGLMVYFGLHIFRKL